MAILLGMLITLFILGSINFFVVWLCEGDTICDIGHYEDCLSNKVLYHTTDENA